MRDINCGFLFHPVFHQYLKQHELIHELLKRHELILELLIELLSFSVLVPRD